MMIEDCFKTVTYDDIDLIKSYLNRYPNRESNHNIVNIYLWLSLYPLYYYQEDDFLVLIASYHNEYFSYVPLCDKSILKEVILKTKELFNKCGLTYHLHFVSEEYKELLLTLFDDIEVKELVNNYDYIYEFNSFKSFKGKKLQKKRNHLNNFYKHYNDRYEFKTINNDNVSDVRDFVLSLNTNDEYANAEKIGIINILSYLDKLEVKSGLMYIDGKLEGMMLVSVIDHMMIQENVEKANKNINGLYQALIFEFFKYHKLEAQYINREDDIGIATLRKAKESYHPVKYIRKYQVTV